MLDVSVTFQAEIKNYKSWKIRTVSSKWSISYSEYMSTEVTWYTEEHSESVPYAPRN